MRDARAAIDAGGTRRSRASGWARSTATSTPRRAREPRSSRGARVSHEIVADARRRPRDAQHRRRRGHAPGRRAARRGRAALCPPVAARARGCGDGRRAAGPVRRRAWAPARTRWRRAPTSERAPATAARLELVSFERDLGALELALAHAEPSGGDGEAGDAARALLDHGEHETRADALAAGSRRAPAGARRQTAPADIVYWDPFSPRANPDLWTVAAFSAARRCRRRVARSTPTARRPRRGWPCCWPGGPSASATPSATRPRPRRRGRDRDLARPLDRGWLARLSRPDVPLPPDAPADAIARATAAPQFTR